MGLKKQAKLMYLPTDVVADILLRVPAEILVEWKRVCKCWNALITDADVIKRHLEYWKLQSRLLPDEDFIKRHLEYWKSQPTILTEPFSLVTFSMPQSPIECSCWKEDYLLDTLLGPGLQKYPHLDTSRCVLSSCDGLLLVKVTMPDPVSKCSGQALIVCNPVTRRQRLLPLCGPLDDLTWTMAFNIASQRYKVVGIKIRLSYLPDERVSQWFVFDLHSHRGNSKGDLGSWKVLDYHTTWKPVSSASSVVTFAGAVHCLMSVSEPYQNKNVILSMDLSTETFMPVKIVNEASIPGWRSRQLFSDRVFCCCLPILDPKKPSEMDYELWIIDDFDNPVWRKRTIIRNIPQSCPKISRDFRRGCSCFVRAGMFFEDEGKLIANLHGEDFTYDVSSGEWTRIEDLRGTQYRVWDFRTLCRHVDSLIVLD